MLIPAVLPLMSGKLGPLISPAALELKENVAKENAESQTKARPVNY